jgi:SAM-dependent methyltransferase
VSTDRARSFGSVAELYDTYRPGPPPALADVIGRLDGLDVLDIAAGTGIVTRFLVSLGATLSAVEPDDDMRAVLERRSPTVRVLRGVAESLPFPDESFDVVVTSSAWHWFSQPAAVNEIARVLRDGGRLFVLSNGFDRDDQWLEDLAALREPGDQSWSANRAYEAIEDLDSRFGDVGTIGIDWTWPRTHEELVQLFRTYSGMITRSQEEQRDVELLVRGELDRRWPEGRLSVPMTLRGVRATRAAR